MYNPGSILETHIECEITNQYFEKNRFVSNCCVCYSFQWNALTTPTLK